MNKLSTQLAVVGTATAMALVFVGAPMEVRADPATNVVCGQDITQDTKMDGDLTCSANLTIVADNVTLDLGGFTITDCCSSFAGVVIAEGRTGVTVKNGAIEGFQVGVFAVTPLNLKLSDLILKNSRAEGVNIFEGGDDVVIKNSSFLLSPPISCTEGSTEAIRFHGVTNLDVNNIDVHGGIRGVILDCLLCDGSLPPNTGKIRNSTFTGSHVGVEIWSTSDVTISNNHFSNIAQTEACEWGFAIILPGQAGPHPRTGIKIKDNFIHDNFEGITLNGLVAGAEIKGNQIRDNSHFGIGLRESAGVPATGNLIKDNMTSGSGVDLLHDVSSSPNTWKNNSCETKEGADIPDC